MNTVLLMMGGSGTRFGAAIPKQYIKVNNRPIFSYILEGYNKLECVDKIIIVSHADWVDYVEEVAKELGVSLSIESFVRFERGQGIEKKEDNFADEVASMIK